VAKRTPFERLVDRATGARLCYGEPVEAAGRTVIPVARVRTIGGLGWGDSGERAEAGRGGGGGGYLDARPLGFIEIAGEATTYHEIPDPERSQRMLKAGAAAIAVIAAALAGIRRLRER
jgi:uncharacterized spore protein YtfJ